MKKLIASVTIVAALSAPIVIADSASARDTGWDCPGCKR